MKVTVYGKRQAEIRNADGKAEIRNTDEKIHVCEHSHCYLRF